MKLDRAMLDISPDDAVDLNNKKRILRWDAKKRKFVKQTLAEMAEVQKKGIKRMRSETGIVSKKSSLPQVSINILLVCHELRIYNFIWINMNCAGGDVREVEEED